MRWPLLLLALAGCVGTHNQRWGYNLGGGHRGTCEAYDSMTHPLAARQTFTLCTDGKNLVVIVPPSGQMQTILSDTSNVLGSLGSHIAIPVTPVP